MSIGYRPEVDGLRAFAVIPVLIFHAGISGFSGGFVGVDVFFVISGFLISKIILTEVESGTFSFGNFYERRVRRILPALILVIFVSLVAGYFLSLPDQLASTSTSAIAAIFAISNVYFWDQSGYFSPASEFSMFLHTWSLGVEEQFYFILPPVLILLHRMRANLRFVIKIVLPLAFLVSLWLSYEKPSVAFFLLPARVWELGIGAALAAGVVPKITSKATSQAVAAIGLLMIMGSVALIDEGMAFPGWAALFPCLGAAAVIHCASFENTVGKLLSLPPIRFIGLISYSLYLWHWPVFVSLRLYYAEAHLPLNIALFGIALSLLLAILSWKYVEGPFRANRKMAFGRVGLSLGTACAGLVIFSIMTISSQGWPQRLNEQTKTFLAAATDRLQNGEVCSGLHLGLKDGCNFGKEGAPIDFAIIGDSHADAIWPAFEALATESGRAGTLFWRGACPILLGATLEPDRDARDCTAFKISLIDHLGKFPDLKTLYIVGRWEAAYTGIASEIGGSYRTYLTDNENPERSDEATKQVFKRSVLRTADALAERGYKVVFVGAVPEVGYNVSLVLALSAFNGSKVRSIDADNDIRTQLDVLFEDVVKQSNRFEYISIWEAFCSPDCMILNNGAPVYRDDDHITVTAARTFVADILRRGIKRINDASGT